jgi:hypothetical protein
MEACQIPRPVSPFVTQVLFRSVLSLLHRSVLSLLRRLAVVAGAVLPPTWRSLSLGGFTLVALGLSASQASRLPNLPDLLSLRAAPVTFIPRIPGRVQVGALTYLSGLTLSSPNPNFGGLSGLLADEPDGQLTVVTDRGYLLSLAPRYGADGIVLGVTEGKIGRLPLERGLNQRRLANKDAESLARSPDGRLTVAFERNDRVRLYDRDLNARTLPKPVALERSRWNGIEAITELPDGRLFALSEGIKRGGGLRAWLYEGGQWSVLVYKSKPDFSPTGATLSPDGKTVFIVERRFISYFQGFEARVVQVAVDKLRANAVVQARTVADFPAGSIAQANLEGIAAKPLPDGRLSLLLISDNNFVPYLQANLLLQFAYDPQRLPSDPNRPPKPVAKPQALGL